MALQMIIWLRKIFLTLTQTVDQIDGEGNNSCLSSIYFTIKKIMIEPNICAVAE